MPRAGKQKKFRIVVAEKNTKCRTIACDLVKRLHCIPIPVESVPEALDAIRTHQTDLVLLDVDLARLENLDAVHTIRQIAPLVPIVMMSQVFTPTLARRLCDRGVQSFLVKPIQLDQLAMTLFRYLL